LCHLCHGMGPPGSGGPPRRQKNLDRGGPTGRGQGFIYPLSRVASKKKKVVTPSPSLTPPRPHKSWKIPWSGPPRSFGMAPPNVLIRACLTLDRNCSVVVIIISDICSLSVSIHTLIIKHHASSLLARSLPTAVGCCGLSLTPVAAAARRRIRYTTFSP
jgi:hypothetical protein